MASIRERNGKFNVIYSYTNEKGERKQKWETYETKAEAKRRKKEIEYKDVYKRQFLYTGNDETGNTGTVEIMEKRIMG